MDGADPTVDRIKRCIDRFYLSMSASEIRESFLYESVNRLPYNTALYLNLIGLNPGITQSEIGDRLGVAKSTVTLTVSRLESKGLIVREKSEKDGRVRKIRLSDEIQKVYDKDNIKMATIMSTLRDEFGTEDQEVFCTMLDRLSELFDGWESQGAGSGGASSTDADQN